LKNRQHTPEEGKELIVLSYISNHEIHITLSSIIKVGLLTLYGLNGVTIYQKVISNTNYEHIALPQNLKQLTVRIVSDSIHYEKIFNI